MRVYGRSDTKKPKGLLLFVPTAALVAVLVLAGFLLPDQERSVSERRTLAQRPELSVETLQSGEFFEELEEYLADQFPGRELFRRIKAAGSYTVLGQLDNDGYYVAEGQIGRLDESLDEKAVVHAAGRFQTLAQAFDGARFYYTVIPDKNYYLAAELGYPTLDYGRLEALMEEELPQMTCLPLFDCFEAEDYYSTDLHLKQPSWVKGADRLLAGMGNSFRASEVSWKTEEIRDFYGTYYGQAAVNLPPDTIEYLSSALTDQAEVYDYEADREISVYHGEALEGPDKYDFFLSGARALLTIENAKAESDRELILVRDSFGSSLAPLLIGGYRKITLIDLRYISADLVAEYVSAKEQCDVLFACSATVLNSGNLLK